MKRTFDNCEKYFSQLSKVLAITIELFFAHRKKIICIPETFIYLCTDETGFIHSKSALPVIGIGIRREHREQPRQPVPRPGKRRRPRRSAGTKRKTIHPYRRYRKFALPYGPHAATEQYAGLGTRLEKRLPATALPETERTQYGTQNPRSGAYPANRLLFIFPNRHRVPYLRPAENHYLAV